VSRGRVYIAAYSHEEDRAKEWMEKVTKAGYEITCDWTVETQRFRALGRPPTFEERLVAAETDTAGVLSADIVWVLCPETGGAGVHSELGIAIGWNRAIEAFGNNTEEPIQLIASGAHARNVFATLARMCFDADEEAFAHITNW
jgi:hypothetical protein